MAREPQRLAAARLGEREHPADRVDLAGRRRDMLVHQAHDGVASTPHAARTVAHAARALLGERCGPIDRVARLDLDHAARSEREPAVDAVPPCTFGSRITGALLLDRERAQALRHVEGRELTRGMGIDELGNGDVERCALDAVRILGRDAQPLRRLARLDLGPIAALAVVVALGKAADVAHESLLGRVVTRQLDDHGILGGDELGHDLRDRAETLVVVEGQADHDAPPFLPAMSPRMRATASGTLSLLSSSNHERSSAGLRSLATSWT